MKTQKARDVTLNSFRGTSRFTLRGRKKKDGVIQGKLRIRSMPGAFLVLGVIVVVVGTALAMAGYWPYRLSKSTVLRASEGESMSESQTSGWSLGAKGLLSTASFIHSERMKLLGPVIMGVGLFILICANTVLYENRDRETQMLLAQMRSVLCSVSTAVPSVDLKEMASASSIDKPYQWVNSLPSAHLHILCLQQLASSEPLLQTRQPRVQENSMQGINQTEALHHQESQSPPSLHSTHSNSCNFSQTDFDIKSGSDHRGITTISSHPAPLIRLNNCLVSFSSMSTLGLEEEKVLVAQLRRCHSMSYRTSHYACQTGMRLEERLHKAREESCINQLAGPQVCLNIPGQALDAVEEKTHRSWPQLNLGCGRRYLKLDSKEDSVDKLLDQLGQQCSQWDKNFGSGPFQ